MNYLGQFASNEKNVQCNCNKTVAAHRQPINKFTQKLCAFPGYSKIVIWCNRMPPNMMLFVIIINNSHFGVAAQSVCWASLIRCVRRTATADQPNACHLYQMLTRLFIANHHDQLLAYKFNNISTIFSSSNWLTRSNWWARARLHATETYLEDIRHLCPPRLTPPDERATPRRFGSKPSSHKSTRAIQVSCPHFFLGRCRVKVASVC